MSDNCLKQLYLAVCKGAIDKSLRQGDTTKTNLIAHLVVERGPEANLVVEEAPSPKSLEADVVGLQTYGPTARPLGREWGRFRRGGKLCRRIMVRNRRGRRHPLPLVGAATVKGREGGVTPVQNDALVFRGGL